MTEIKRKTNETDIKVTLDINGVGKSSIDTGIGFFDHMLESFAKHSLIDLNIECKGDLEVDFHHSVEDVGIVIGKALRDEIYPLKSMERFADATIVMDEASVKCALDLSNRPYLVYEVPVFGKIGEFDAELAEEFFRALVFNASINAHIIKERGNNKHHIVEATFKSFAIALRRALAYNDRVATPSTKGIL
jgi:imidazoleglycerol-phosphate dehydratase